MPDPLARAIVAEALRLAGARSDLAPLQVLDLAMRGRRGMAIDFGALDGPEGSLAGPSTDFGALLAAAFDDQLTFSAVHSVPGRPNAFEEFWHERVMRAFVQRYALRAPPR